MSVTVTVDPQMIIARIDAIIRELETLRQLLAMPVVTETPRLAEQLFGALGHGTWEEYDWQLDWARFSA